MKVPTILWTNGTVRIIDQRQLPLKVKFIVCRDVRVLWKAIRTLAVRGAPALGVAAGFGVLLGIKKIRAKDRSVFDGELKKICRYLATSRPTAVNLFAALERMQNIAIQNPQASVAALKELLKKEALAISKQEQKNSQQMGEHGAQLVKNGHRLLTICNAGALATSGEGTALAVMYAAKKHNKKFKVYACETRPLLQGARLTTWELKRAGIDVTLICDAMAASLMQEKKVDMVFVGADRIALNGDTANKIGTYNLAVLAGYHRIPFYVVAPFSTFDAKIKTGKDIPIEQRDPREVTTIASKTVAPKGIAVYNPAFDVTPQSLITGIVTENGLLRPAFRVKILKQVLKNKNG